MIPLKVVFVMPSMKAGGGNRVFVEISNVLAHDFQEINIFYLNNSQKMAPYRLSEKVNLVAVGKNAVTIIGKLRNLFYLFILLNRLLSRDPSVIVVLSDPIICAMSFLLKKRYSSRIIRFIQADDYRIFDDLYVLKRGFLLRIYRMLCLQNYKRKYNYIFNSVFTYNQFLEVSYRNDVPLYRVHPSINKAVFKFENKKDSEELIICLVVRKHPMKGFSDFLEAWKLLDPIARQKVTKVYIISHDDLSQFDLKDFNVIAPANDNEIAEIMNKSHIFISTSWWEGFGLPPLEAMACGCAILSSNSGGPLEYAKENENCLLYRPKDVNELINKLELMINNESLRNQLSAAGLNTSYLFSWEKANHQFIEIIKKITQVKC